MLKIAASEPETAKWYFGCFRRYKLDTIRDYPIYITEFGKKQNPPYFP